jgi:hypothetical protein
MRSKQSWNKIKYVRSYAKCDFASQLHFDHHHHQNAPFNICLQPTKKNFKIRKLFSCGHYLKHLIGRDENGAHAENLVGPSPTLGLSAALELHHTS